MSAQLLYKFYGLLYTARLWRKRHFTPAGMMMLWAVLLSGLFGFNIMKTDLYQVLALSFSIMSVSMVLNLLPFKPKIKINRILPDYAGIDTELTYELEITNLSSKTQKGLILYENVYDPRPSLKALLSKKEPFEHTRNIWDKKTLYYRWLWLAPSIIPGVSRVALIRSTIYLCNSLEINTWLTMFCSFVKSFSVIQGLMDSMGCFCLCSDNTATSSSFLIYPG